MVRTGQGIAALLPPSMRDDFEGLITQGAIKKLVEVENYRVSADGLPNPGVHQKLLYSDELPSLADTIEQRIGNLKEGHDRAGLCLPRLTVAEPLPTAPEPSPVVADYSVDWRGFDVVTGDRKPMEAAHE